MAHTRSKENEEIRDLVTEGLRDVERRETVDDSEIWTGIDELLASYGVARNTGVPLSHLELAEKRLVTYRTDTLRLDSAFEVLDRLSGRKSGP